MYYGDTMKRILTYIFVGSFIAPGWAALAAGLLGLSHELSFTLAHPAYLPSIHDEVIQTDVFFLFVFVCVGIMLTGVTYIIFHRTKLNLDS